MSLVFSRGAFSHLVGSWSERLGTVKYPLFWNFFSMLLIRNPASWFIRVIDFSTVITITHVDLFDSLLWAPWPPQLYAYLMTLVEPELKGC